MDGSVNCGKRCFFTSLSIHAPTGVPLKGAFCTFALVIAPLLTALIFTLTVPLRLGSREPHRRVFTRFMEETIDFLEGFLGPLFAPPPPPKILGGGVLLALPPLRFFKRFDASPVRRFEFVLRRGLGVFLVDTFAFGVDRFSRRLDRFLDLTFDFLESADFSTLGFGGVC